MFQYILEIFKEGKNYWNFPRIFPTISTLNYPPSASIMTILQYGSVWVRMPVCPSWAGIGCPDVRIDTYMHRPIRLIGPGMYICTVLSVEGFMMWKKATLFFLSAISYLLPSGSEQHE